MIRYTLLTDGPSDRLLRFPIEWLLERLTALDFEGEWANPAILGRPKGLDERIAAALENYPCQLLFVHRDAERDPREVRVAEIENALRNLACPPPAVCVVPVRMTEAWLLFNDRALREAASNPNGQMDLILPAIKTLEFLPLPKQLLRELLERASGLNKRRLKRFRWSQARQRVAELIDDFSPLEALPAFQSFRDELKQVLVENGWA
jgi:hypothetical protein